MHCLIWDWTAMVVSVFSVDYTENISVFESTEFFIKFTEIV